MIKKIFYKLGLVDRPNKLKQHKENTILFGGIFFLSILFFQSFFLKSNEFTNLYLIILITLVGIWDDSKNLNANFKFILTMIIFFINHPL